MSGVSQSALPSPEDWEWFKAVLEEAESIPDSELTPGGRVAWVIDQTRRHRPGMLGFVERHACHMLNSETRVLSRPSVRMLEMDSWPGHLFDTGDVVGNRYTVTRFLGAGGMGEVYEVADSELHGRSVALKTIRGDLAGTRDADSRFEREVRTALAVSHSNVCRIYDVGRHRSGEIERLFLTMELLSGTLLSERVRPAPPLKSNSAALPPGANPDMASTVTSPVLTTWKASEAEALKIIRQLAAGLAAIHSGGIVHRDFKPANVMLVPEPDGTCRVVIMDFGLARVLDMDVERAVTQTGLHPGTPAYMAPEQLTGSGPSTFASDVYSLGVTMHEILTGRRYELNGSFKALQRAGVSPWLRAVVIRCLAADREQRFQNAGEVVEALDDRARRRFVPRSRLVFGAGAVGIAVCIPFAMWYVQRPSPPQAAAVRAYLQGIEDLHSAAPFLASTRFREALRLHPRYAVASARLAQAWLGMEAVGRARDAILAASSPELAKTMDENSRDLCEAVRLSVLGNHAKAIPLFEKLATTAPDEDKTNARIDLAWELDRANERARALKIWESLAPMSPYAAFKAATEPNAKDAPRLLEEARAGFERAHNIEGESEVMFWRAYAMPSSSSDEARRLLQAVADRARMSHDVHQEAKANLQAAFFDISSGEPEKAEEHAAQAMQIARSGGVEFTLGRALRALGTGSVVKGDRVKAEQYFSDSVRLARENRDRGGEADALQLLSEVHNRMGRPEAAEREALEAYSFYSAGSQIKLAIQSAVTLTNARREQGKFTLAEQSLASARKAYGLLKEPDGEQLSRIQLCAGQLDRLKGLYCSAAFHTKAALETAKAANYRLVVPYDELLLAEDLAKSGDLYGAKTALDQLSGQPRFKTDVLVRRLMIDFYAAPKRASLPQVNSLLEKVTDPEDRVDLQLILLRSDLDRHDFRSVAKRIDGPLKAPDRYLRRESRLELRVAQAQALTALGRKAEASLALGAYEDFASHQVLAWRAALAMSKATEGDESATWRAKAATAFQAFRSAYGEAEFRTLLNNRNDLAVEWKEIENH